MVHCQKIQHPMEDRRISKTHFPQVKRKLATWPDLLTFSLWSSSNDHLWVLSEIELLKPLFFYNRHIVIPRPVQVYEWCIHSSEWTSCCHTSRFIFQLHRGPITVLHLFFYHVTHQNVNNEWSSCVCKAPRPTSCEVQCVLTTQIFLDTCDPVVTVVWPLFKPLFQELFPEHQELSRQHKDAQTWPRWTAFCQVCSHPSSNTYPWSIQVQQVKDRSPDIPLPIATFFS